MFRQLKVNNEQVECLSHSSNFMVTFTNVIFSFVVLFKLNFNT